MLRWQDLVEWSDDDLSRLDPIEVNLACAANLSGAEQADLEGAKRFAEDAACRVKRETARLYTVFDRNPAEYNHSRAYFRVLVLVTVLQRDLGLRYNMGLNDLNDSDFFRDARNLFVHGVTQQRAGTCSSLPVFYLAVGRRLGYPLKLVSAKQHRFARWDEPHGERFNIESTSRGLVSHLDDYYLTWPLPTTPEDIEKGCLLRSMTAREELAAFIGTRGCCCVSNNRLKEAVEAQAWAAELVPDNYWYRGSLCYVMDRWRERLNAVWPPGFPTMTIAFPPRQFKVIPCDLERVIQHLEVMDNLLMEPHFQGRWWTALREGRRPADVPAHITVRYKDRLHVHVQFHGVKPLSATSLTN